MILLSKINKSVTLKPGEKFTLPPDSTLLTTTGVMTSTGCPIPIPQLPEELACYGLNFSIVDGRIGGQSPAMSGLVLTGFKIVDKEILFSTPSGNIDNGFEVIPLDTYCLGTPDLRDLFTFICPSNKYDVWGDIASYSSTFKMKPSLAKDSYLIGYYPGQVGHSPRVDVLFKIKPVADLTVPAPCACT